MARDAPNSRRAFAISNVRVFNGQSLTQETVVYISDGIIASNALNPEIIDGQGGVLIPGLIDAHMHLNTVHELEVMARLGVTTALDMATWPTSKIDALRGLSGVTDFRTPGPPASSPGSMHSVVLPLPKSSLLTSAEDAVKFVQDRVAEGADYIKVIADVPGPDQAIVNAVVSEAHKHEKLVVAHAVAFHPFQMAQEAGVDIITHAPCDRPLDEAAAQRMAREQRVSVPTLVMMQAICAPLSWYGIFQLLRHPMVFLGGLKVMRQKRAREAKGQYKNARDSVAALHRAGVPILAGSDAHAEATSPVSVKHGYALHQELELLVEAGLSNLEVLQAATSLPAKHFGLHDRGSVEVGKRADLVLLTANPLEDIRNSQSISHVWCAGVPVVI